MEGSKIYNTRKNKSSTGHIACVGVGVSEEREREREMRKRIIAKVSMYKDFVITT
jgi:hypothetical protein